MKSLFIKVNALTDVTELVRLANSVDGDIEIRKGRWCIDAASFMGVMSIDLSTGVTVVYPEDATEFENFITNFKA